MTPIDPTFLLIPILQVVQPVRPTSTFFVQLSDVDFFRDVQIDGEFGGWFGNLMRSGQITDLNQKGHAWKAAYHDGRAMMRIGARC